MSTASAWTTELPFEWYFEEEARVTFSGSTSVACRSPATPSQDESRGIAGRQVDLSGISFKSVSQGDSYSWES